MGTLLPWGSPTQADGCSRCRAGAVQGERGEGGQNLSLPAQRRPPLPASSSQLLHGTEKGRKQQLIKINESEAAISAGMLR